MLRESGGVWTLRPCRMSMRRVLWTLQPIAALFEYPMLWEHSPKLLAVAKDVQQRFHGFLLAIGYDLAACSLT